MASGAVVATTVAGPASADNLYSNLITLQTGATNQVTYYPPNKGIAATPQPLSASSCRLTSNSAVVKFEGSGKVGLRQGSIGIINGGTGESCGQINAPSEFLSLDLGTKVATRAVLDVELQKNAVVLAALTRGSTTSYVELQSGASVTGTRTPPSAGGAPEGASVTVALCQTDNSSASNSGPSDNCRWVIDDAPFSKISLKTIKGNASLEGGADGTVTRLSRDAQGTPDTEPLPAAMKMSYFMIADLFACRTGSVTVNGLDGAPTVTVREVDVTSGALCEDFVYELTTSGVKASFTKPYSAQSNRLEFMMDLKWPIPAAPDNLAVLPQVSFGFHDVDLNEGPAEPLRWCADPVFNTEGLVTDLASPVTEQMEADYFPFYAGNLDFPGIQYACMATSDLVREAGKPVAWVQSIYVHGDAYARR